MRSEQMKDERSGKRYRSLTYVLSRYKSWGLGVSSQWFGKPGSRKGFRSDIAYENLPRDRKCLSMVLWGCRELRVSLLSAQPSD